MARWKALALAVVLLAVFFQVGQTLANAIGPLDQVRRVIGQPAIWRGVNFSSGQDLANYVEFLDSTIPQQAKVVLPPAGVGPASISRTPYMQFYLAPRQVVNCPAEAEACAENYSAGGAYVLVVRRDQFPSSRLLEEKDRLVFYNENLGVLLPPAKPGVSQAGESNTPPATGNTSLIQAALKLVWPGLWLLSLTVGGWLVCSRLAPAYRQHCQDSQGSQHSQLSQPGQLSRLAMGFGLGVGAFSFALYLALLAGFALNRTLVIGVTLGWVIFAVLIYFVRIVNRRVVIWREMPGYTGWRWQTADRAALILFIGLTGLATILAIGQGYHWSDEVVLWGVKGYGITALGLAPGVSEWGTRTTSYPLHLPLMIAAFRTLFGDRLPESKLIFPIYYFSLLIIQYDFLRQRLVARRAVALAGAATLLFAATPLIFYHATLAYANLPLTFSLAGAGILLVTAFSAPDERATLGWLGLSGVFLALAGWTRPDGLVLSVLVAALAGLWILFTPALRRKWAALVALGGPLLVYSAIWLATAARVYSQPGWSGSAFRAGFEQILAGHINMEASRFVLSSVALGFVDLTTWGILGFVLLVLILIFAIFFKRNRPNLFLIAAGLLCLLAVSGLYLLLANDPASNISWWVDTGLSRMLLPGITLLWIGMSAWAIILFVDPGRVKPIEHPRNTKEE